MNAPCHCPQPSGRSAGYDSNQSSEVVLSASETMFGSTALFPQRRQSSGVLLPYIVSLFLASFHGHTSGTPKLKGDRPDHSAAMLPAIRPIGMKISEGTCQALHLKAPRKKQVRAMQLCECVCSVHSSQFRVPNNILWNRCSKGSMPGVSGSSLPPFSIVPGDLSLFRLWECQHLSKLTPFCVVDRLLGKGGWVHTFWLVTHATTNAYGQTIWCAPQPTIGSQTIDLWGQL